MIRETELYCTHYVVHIPSISFLTVDVPTAPPEDDGGDNSSAVIAGSVVAVTAVCVVALLVLFIAVMVVIKVTKQRHVEAASAG